MTLAPRVVSALATRGWTLGAAESLTGGALAAEIVAVPGASAVFRGGVVAYATPVKHTLLGVDAELLALHGAVHREVAIQMASGIRRAMVTDAGAADVGVSTTGIAGPDSPDGQPVGTVHVAVVTPETSVHRWHVFAGNRTEVRMQSVEAAFELLLEALGE